jgi:hypothetical protein
MDQVIQVFGSLLILAAFGAAQLGRVSPQSLVYLWLNLVGSAILAVLAYLEEQWGFLLLETVWAVVTAYGLMSVTRAARRA